MKLIKRELYRYHRRQSIKRLRIDWGLAGTDAQVYRRGLKAMKELGNAIGMIGVTADEATEALYTMSKVLRQIKQEQTP